MTDIVERIRNLRFVHIPGTSHLMEEACQEIERLRNVGACPHVRGTVTQYCSLNFTLTDEEREAVEWCRDNITAMAHPSSAFAYIHADTLRKLLERLHT